MSKKQFFVGSSKAKSAKLQEILLWISNEETGRVQSFKYLGLFVDEELIFEDHINYIYTVKAAQTGFTSKKTEAA